MNPLGRGNTVHLIADFLARDALRWSPGGIPILGATVQHRSTQIEAGIPRDVTLELPIRAAGQLAERLDRVALGASLSIQGFLAPRSRNGKGLILHLTQFEIEPGEALLCDVPAEILNI